MSELKKCIETLIRKAADANDFDAAMRFSQAALNASHALNSMTMNSDMEKRRAILGYNSALRSAAEVAERSGNETNWPPFLAMLKATLNEHQNTFVEVQRTTDPL